MTTSYICQICEVSFAEKRNLDRHQLMKKASCLSRERVAEMAAEIANQRAELIKLKRELATRTEAESLQCAKLATAEKTIDVFQSTIKKLENELRITTGITDAGDTDIHYLVNKLCATVNSHTMDDATKVEVELLNCIIHLIKYDRNVLSRFVEQFQGTTDVTYSQMEAFRAGLKRKRNTIPDDWVLDVQYDQDHMCNMCKCKLPRGEKTDHIVPLCFGGKNDKTNLQSLCGNCHNEKTLDEKDDFIRLMTQLHQKLIRSENW